MLKTLQQASLSNINKPASPIVFRWIKAVKGLTLSLAGVSMIASLPWVATGILLTGALCDFILAVLPNNSEEVKPSGQ